jgi:hypothetical protein
MPNCVETKFVRDALKDLMRGELTGQRVMEVFSTLLREEEFIGDRVGTFDNLIDTRVTRLTAARLNNRDWDRI